MYCSKCGTQNEDVARFCRACGTQLKSSKNQETGSVTSPRLMVI